MRLLVLAGGLGTRLQSVVSAVPKAMAPIGNESFLYYRLQNWIKQVQRSFVFLLHHKADIIVGYLAGLQNGLPKDCDVAYVVEPFPMDTGGTVAHAVDEVGLVVDAGCLNQVAGIAMSEVQRATAGASTSTAKAARSGGVLFVHRFGATLNAHVHLHLCMLDGVVAPGR